MRTQSLQYYMHDGPAAFRFELAGELDDVGARRLEQDLRTARLIVDVTKRVRNLLARWHALPESRAKSAIRNWLPFQTSLLVRPIVMLLMAAAVFPIEASAATLKPETVADWENYLQTVSSALENRCHPGTTFLWVDEAPERLAKVHDGEIIVAPAAARIPMKVRGGLIHHWIGAAFLPDAKVDDILDVIRDYDRYKDFYPPSVVESKVLARNDSNEKFTMQLVNHEFFAKMAVDADYKVTNLRLDHSRFYSVARTTRVQQIENYGEPGEHMIPEGQGGGYIWKLFSIARLEQRDGGVYVEMETVALSRGIPAAFRFVADPIVRRVSRSAMLTAIKQTEEAVLCNTLTTAKPATCPGGRTASAVTARRVE
jgi:hypothetical protein